VTRTTAPAPKPYRTRLPIKRLFGDDRVMIGAIRRLGNSASERKKAEDGVQK
jgi:hypothetical protein